MTTPVTTSVTPPVTPPSRPNSPAPQLPSRTSKDADPLEKTPGKTTPRPGKGGIKVFTRDVNHAAPSKDVQETYASSAQASEKGTGGRLRTASSPPRLGARQVRTPATAAPSSTRNQLPILSSTSATPVSTASISSTPTSTASPNYPMSPSSTSSTPVPGGFHLPLQTFAVQVEDAPASPYKPNPFASSSSLVTLDQPTRPDDERWFILPGRAAEERIAAGKEVKKHNVLYAFEIGIRKHFDDRGIGAACEASNAYLVGKSIILPLSCNGRLKRDEFFARLCIGINKIGADVDALRDLVKIFEGEASHRSGYPSPFFTVARIFSVALRLAQHGKEDPESSKQSMKGIRSSIKLLAQDLWWIPLSRKLHKSVHSPSREKTRATEVQSSPRQDRSYPEPVIPQQGASSAMKPSSSGQADRI